MPLIHIIDLYLTFKFCPLSDKRKGSYFSAGSVWADHLHAGPPQRQRKRERWWLLSNCIYVAFIIIGKKEKTCNFPAYVLGFKGCRSCDDFSMVNSSETCEKQRLCISQYVESPISTTVGIITPPVDILFCLFTSNSLPFYLTHSTIYNLILSSPVSFISKAQRSNNIMILSSVTSIYV